MELALDLTLDFASCVRFHMENFLLDKRLSLRAEIYTCPRGGPPEAPCKCSGHVLLTWPQKRGHEVNVNAGYDGRKSIPYSERSAP